jgi:hypothetical protein
MAKTRKPISDEEKARRKRAKATGVQSSPKGQKLPRGTVGRPTDLTDELMVNIVNMVRAGNYIETAAAMYHVSKQSIYQWMKRGNEEPGTIFAKFTDALKAAWAESEARDVVGIGDSDQWQAKAWRLERKFPDRWGRKERLDIKHSGSVATSQAVDLSKLSVEELRVFEQLLGKCQVDGDAAGSEAGAGAEELGELS